MIQVPTPSAWRHEHKDYKGNFDSYTFSAYMPHANHRDVVSLFTLDQLNAYGHACVEAMQVEIDDLRARLRRERKHSWESGHDGGQT